MDKREELLEASQAATDALRTLRDERDNKKYASMNALEAALKAEFGERLNALTKAASAAESAHRDEEARIRTEAAKPPFPVGTVLDRWDTPGRWAREKKPTGERGVVEIFGPDSQSPANMQHNLARTGDVVIRFVKKDGTPSLRYEVWTDWRKDSWRLPQTAAIRTVVTSDS